jgi:hypothetical protein
MDSFPVVPDRADGRVVAGPGITACECGRHYGVPHLVFRYASTSRMLAALKTNGYTIISATSPIQYSPGAVLENTRSVLDEKATRVAVLAPAAAPFTRWVIVADADPDDGTPDPVTVHCDHVLAAQLDDEFTSAFDPTNARCAPPRWWNCRAIPFDVLVPQPRTARSDPTFDDTAATHGLHGCSEWILGDPLHCFSARTHQKNFEDEKVKRVQST